ncbi:hypothetical protein [Paraburkholderia phenazinium]|jgi:hypothetical protein|uniref:Uncharacterized protein n=1 Tax=Paraburkholderia phenazinium TaxID=60549 RepID=A0A1G8MDH2_9BURK|nr:hypothetical protein [Paraburkholderia phenazinium]SDI65951.1 hypothetical protein SAMN05216466_12938 [Paraburkholderia phenazinium]
MKKTIRTKRFVQGVLVLACVLYGSDGIAAAVQLDAATVSKNEGAVAQIPQLSQSGNRLSGDESMWGVLGKPAEPILNLINASPLMVSELSDYRDAVNAHTALPFGDLKEDWSGAKMLVLPDGIKQIVISSDVVAASPGELVGDLSHGLSYFRNYDNDRRLYDALVGKLPPDDPKYRMMIGFVGVGMTARAEVNNYIIQQQILARTATETGGAVTIKLANDKNSKGLLQSTLDNVYAPDRAQGVPPEQDTAKLEKAAFVITRSIPIPRRSAQ